MKPGTRFDLLVLARGQDLSENIQRCLRNDGHAVRTHWCQSLDALAKALGTYSPDLVICEEQTAPDAPLHATELAHQHDEDLPVIVVGSERSDMRAVGALNIGASEYVAADNPRLLALVCLRELRVFADRKRMRDLFDRVKSAEALARNVIRDSDDPTLLVQEGIIVDINPAFAEMLGSEPDALQALPLLDVIAEPDQPVIKGLTARALKHARFDPTLAGKDTGGERKTPALYGDARLSRVNGSLTASQRIEFSASEFDDEPALRVRMRRGAAPQQEGRAATRRGELFEAMTLDDVADDGFARGAIFVCIDGFRVLESRIGFLDAEEVVTALLELLAPMQSPGDQVFPFSAQEFVLVCRRDSPEAIREFGEKIRETIAEHTITTRDHETNVTVSLVAFPMSGHDAPQEALAKLRNAARTASEEGGNTVRFIGDTAEASVRRKEAERRAQAIETAMKERRLRLVYQPIASLEGDDQQISDSHVRMFDMNGNEYTATEFLPVAIEFGLMPKIDLYVANVAISTLLKDDARNSAIFLRVSKQTMSDPKTFIKTVAKALKAGKVAENRLVLEISERVLQDNLGKAKSVIDALGKVGVALAIDRFGTSPSALRLMAEFKPRFVKLDPSFTRALTSTSEADKRGLLEQIVSEAKEMQVRTVAEHIENANGMAQLWQMGINYVQGNHVHEPEVVLTAA